MIIASNTREVGTHSRRVLRAVAPFGLLLDGRVGSATMPSNAALGSLTGLGGGRVALLTGASGSGKSTVMRTLRTHLMQRGERVVHVEAGAFARTSRAVVEVVGGRLEQAMEALAAAGLGEASLLARPACALSDGERWRLSLARAMVVAQRGCGEGVWVLGDEFCSSLDRTTAHGVAVCVRRWAGRHRGVRVVCATAHEDMPGMLRPDVLVRVSPDGSSRVEAGRARGPGPRVRVEDGSIEDYDALGGCHYRGGRPATWTRVLRAWRGTPRGPLLAGVLVVSRPTLNAAWRDLPWPGRYTRGPLRPRALRINRELRCISRVVVEPRSRGMGVARRLVGAYLRSPQTPATEALAAMGAFCPFFERAGMRVYRTGVLAPDARLGDALTHAGYEANELLVADRADEAAGDPLVRRELARWANASRATRGQLGRAWGDVARSAGVRLASRPVGYAHVVGSG